VAIAEHLLFPKTRRLLGGAVARIGLAGLAAWVVGLVSLSVFEALRARADDLGAPIRGAGAEQALFGGLPTVWLQETFYARWPDVAGPALAIVHASWFFVPLLAAIFVTVAMPRRLPSFFGVWIALELLSLAVFAVVPMQPPWMADARVVRVFDIYVNAEVDPNQVAAMPSLHVAFPVALGLWFIGERCVKAGIVMLTYASLIGLEVVASGEHYVVDALAAVAVAAVAVAAVRAAAPVAAWLGGLPARMRPAPALRGARAEGGQSLIEFALLFPIVLVFLAALVIFGLALNARASLQQGVREGARYAAVQPSDEAGIQSRTAGNAPDWLTASEVIVCLPSGSSGGIGEAIRVQLEDKDDGDPGIAYDLVPVNGIFDVIGVDALTVRLDPKGTSRLEKSVTGVAAC
jgi:hypothetical protein